MSAPGTPRERGLDPAAEAMKRLAQTVLERVLDDLAQLSHKPVSAAVTPHEAARAATEPLPLEGHGAADSAEAFFERIVPALTRVHHPRFHAYIPSPSSYYALLGQLLEAGFNPFVGSWLGGKAIANLEVVVLRWLAEAIGFDADAAGVLTSGGSMANLNAIVTARSESNAALEESTLYVSDQGHHSVQKAAQVAGFRPDRVRIVPSDAEFRLDLAALVVQMERDRRAGLTPVMVCGNAGTTNTGAIDPLPELAELCRNEGIWFHVDAAYGGFAALDPVGRARLRGMELADSLTLDPHKWLYAPMGTGCFYCRRPGALERAFHAEGDYLQDVPREEVNFFDRGIELSRPARVLPLWMLLRSAGIKRLAYEIGRDLELAQVARERLLADPDLEPAAPTELSVIAFRHRPLPGESERDRSARDHRLMDETLHEGDVMLSTTELRGRTALRFVVMNHRTTEHELDRSIAAVRRHVVRRRLDR